MSASSSLLGSCDEPDILLSQTTPVCLMSAEPGHSGPARGAARLRAASIW
jgi:hypothetical protein